MRTLPNVYDLSQTVRVQVTLAFSAAGILGCALFILTYIASGQYLLILGILIPFVFPLTSLALLIWRTRRYLYVKIFWFYFYTVMGLLNLNSTPDYLVDLFICIPISGIAFLALRGWDAIIALVYLWTLYVSTALIVYFYEPFPILYSNESVSSIRVAFFLALVIGCVTFYAFSRFYQQASDRLGSSLVALQKANDDNAMLLNVLFHDFRNYLQIVNMDLEKLELTGSQAEQKNIQSHIGKVVRELSELLNQVQHIESQFQKDDEPPNEVVSFNSVVEKLELLFRHQLLTKEIQLRKDYADEVMIRINPDVFIHLIAGNVFGNAVKFTPAGECVCISAKENAEGIRLAFTNPTSKEHLDNLNKISRNQQIKQSNPGSEEEPGQGMGISIVRYFCRLNKIGFSTSVSELPDKEALEFTVELNLPLQEMRKS